MKALESIRRNVFMALRRFPVAVLASALFCVLAIAEYKADWIYATLFCACFWSISAMLFAESRDMPKWRGIALSLIGAGLFGLLFGSVSDVEQPLLFLGPAAFLSMGVAPYLRKPATAGQMEYFCSALAKNITFTFLVALVIFLGGSAILASLHYLFALPVRGEVYLKIWLFCATFFAPVFAMGALPRDLQAVRSGYDRAEMLLLGNVMLPLLLIYAAILWLYALKIGITMELPKGNVAYMVCSFAGVGVALYLATVSPHAQAHRLMALWQRHFVAILSVPFALLCIGIWVRIREYGVTEERYAVALMTLWLGGMMAFFLLSHSERRPIILYASAIIVLALASFGPWGAAATSQRSQIARLETLLERHGILQDDMRIIPADSKDVPKAEQAEITSIVAYLASTHKVAAICPWFSAVKDSGCATRHTTKIMESMGLEYMTSHQYGQQQGTKIPFRRNGISVSAKHGVDVRGYDYITALGFYRRGDGKNQTVSLSHETADFTAEFDAPANRVILTTGAGQEPLVFPLDGLLPYLQGNDKQALEKAEFHIDASNPHYDSRIYIQRVNGHFDKDSIAHITNLSILLLYKRR